MVRSYPSAFLLCLAIATSAPAAGVVTDAVTTSQNVPNAINAVGLPTSVSGAPPFASDTTPFTPAYTSLAILGDTTASTVSTAAASITLHFAQPVITGPGAEIGIYTNVGLVADFDPNTSIITAAAGPAFFSDIPQKAIVSVSSDNLTYIPLNGGTAIDLAMVANAFTNSTLVYDTSFFYVDAFAGTIATDPFKPFTGNLADFAGKTQAQMITMFNGSAGGKWLDVSSSGLSEVNYVCFEVPQGSNYRLVLDAVTGNSAAVPVPEPASLALFGTSVALLALRRRRA